ncbi:unnamed protein product [Enterobius vermicularis]|uniref:Ribonuclease n=1 Tax=Enterobius vermicularis TaxID=51028 RepID=A0A0N4VQ53_ENTVE|nr:unnamed protein product [Enterobius vermicularis]
MAYLRSGFVSSEIVVGPDFKNFNSVLPCVLGIDEAGRGPVLGPMVYACAVSPVDKTDQLKELGVDDSKLLTETKRLEVFNSMGNRDDGKKIVSYAYKVLSARLISCAMLRRCKYSLNELSHESAIALIKEALDNNINVTEVCALVTVNVMAGFGQIISLEHCSGDEEHTLRFKERNLVSETHL